MYIDIQQNTDEWLEARAGKVTGSAISKVMAHFGKAFGEPAKSLAVEIAIARITGRPVGGGYSNGHMERGHDQEPIARMLYEDEYFCTVDNGGFFDNGFTGCSPDGLVGDEGMVEIKSVIPSVQYKRIKSGTYDTAYRWQLLFNLRETGREWIDYISFCAEFPANRRLFVTRLCAPDHEELFNNIGTRLDDFRKVVDRVEKDIRSAA